MGKSRTPSSLSTRILHEPRLRRAVILVTIASLVFLLSVGNLVAVAEGHPRVTPARAPSQTWTAGAGADADRGQAEWSFLVDPMGRRVVELELRVPFDIQIDHTTGESRLFGNVRVWVDGVQERAVTRHVTVIADDAHLRVERGDLGPQFGRLVLERAPDAPPFPVHVTWDWNYEAREGATRYTVRVGFLEAQPVVLAGIPGCTETTCARILLLAALVTQGVAVAWFLHTMDAPRQETPEGRARTDKEK